MKRLAKHVRVESHGTISLVRPLTKLARKWLRENVDSEATWFGRALVVEPRYLDDLLSGFELALEGGV